MRLDVLVPKYRETDYVIKNLLGSIGLQQAVDFTQIRVIICNDGGESLDQRKFKNYPFRIMYYETNHSGVSTTRNHLFDLSDADYIMCCDADDMFVDMLGLSYVFKAMAKGFDVFNSSFYEEGKVNDGPSRIAVRKNDTCFVHGKVFRRKYLIDNNIRWNDEFTYSGDSYFLGLALRTTKQHIYCSTPFYLWKWNPNSICRSEKGHYEKELDQKIRVTSALIDELLARGMTEDARYFALFVVYDAYYIMQSSGWEAMTVNERTARIVQLRQFYKKYEPLIKEADKKMLLPVIKTAKNNQFMHGNIMEKITFNDWLNGILSE